MVPPISEIEKNRIFMRNRFAASVDESGDYNTSRVCRRIRKKIAQCKWGFYSH